MAFLPIPKVEKLGNQSCWWTRSLGPPAYLFLALGTGESGREITNPDPVSETHGGSSSIG